jgi:hypothetical protein
MVATFRLQGRFAIRLLVGSARAVPTRPSLTILGECPNPSGGQCPPYASTRPVRLRGWLRDGVRMRPHRRVGTAHQMKKMSKPQGGFGNSPYRNNAS